MTRRQQNTAIFDWVVSQVTITDPTHPLAGRTFPLCQTDDPVTRTCVVIELPSGEHRQIPRKATSLAELKDAASEPQVPLNPVSVRTLLPLLPVVHRLLGVTEESVNDNNLLTRTLRVGLAPTAPDITPSDPVVDARSASATSTGPVSGGANPAPTTARRICANPRGHRS